MTEEVVLAKPTGVTYDEHVSNVINQAKEYLLHHDFVIGKFKEKTGESLGDWLLQAAKFHDVGKKDKRWQRACKTDFEEYLKISNKNQFRAKNLQALGKQKLRHELFPLNQLKSRLKLSTEVLLAIAAHHGKLSKAEEERFNESGAREFWQSFRKLDEKIASQLPSENLLGIALQENYRHSAIRYLLQLADHRASASEPPGLAKLPTFKAFQYDFPEEWEKRKVQQLAEDNWGQPLLLLRAPTGGGKTDASLLWARKQIENGKADRVVICMPTRFTSNALEIAVANQLSSTGLYHSSAWYSKHLKQSQESNQAKRDEKQKFSFARTLEVPVTVCTIDHLLISLTQCREDHHGIFFNLAHSCVIIDEADFYDEFTQTNIQVLLKVLRHLDIPTLIMSATLPESAIKFYQEAGFDDVVIQEDASQKDVVKCEIVESVNYSEPNDLEHLLLQCLDQPAIIYANTVDKAFQFYKWFSTRGFKDVTLYHSRFTEPDKNNKEEELVNKLGKDAWKNCTAHGVAILTQIGELSINISADLMLTDLAPGDRLVQRLGRLSRFKSDYGRVYILLPQKEGTLYPAPYGDYKRPDWIPSPYLIETEKLFKPGKYTAGDFVELVNKIYPKQKERGAKAIDNANQLFNYLFTRWLFLPAENIGEEDEATTHWKSRDIPPSVDVFVNEPQSFYPSYERFMEYKIENSVTLPKYIVDKAKKDHLLSSFTIMINDVEHNILFDGRRCYSPARGFIIETKGFEDQSL